MRDSLRGKSVTLRHFYRENNQRFDIAGNPIFRSDECSWTYCSTLFIKNVRIKHDTLQIMGEREDVHFEGKNFRFLKEGTKITVSIALAPEQDRESTLQNAIRIVFLTANEKLSDVVPPLWSLYMEYAATGKDILLKIGEKRSPSSDPTPVPYSGGLAYRLHDNMTPPKDLVRSDPAFTVQARLRNVQGTALFRAVIGTDGLVHDARVIKPLGADLDEQSEMEFRKWQFKPAEKDGKPIACLIVIEVNFHRW